MEKTVITAAAIFGFLAVAFGAFGAHSLADYFKTRPNLEANYQTATLYMMFHVAALIGTAWAISHYGATPWFTWAGYLFIVGIVLFSGSLYTLSLTGIRWLGAITPLGGVAMLGGWVALLVGVWRQ